MRRRCTEELRFVRYPSKKAVVIGPVHKVGGAFEADFVPPRLFSQLNPFGDHHTALSIELGVYQVARAALTKFEGLKNVKVPVIKNESTWRSFPSIESNVLIRIEQTKAKKWYGKDMRFFKVTVPTKTIQQQFLGMENLALQ